MSVIGHYLEQEGIPTASISLIRLHTETTRPPRALWVPFELGRPMGAPHDVGFQTRVLQSLLSLFERTDGPVVLEDFTEDAPKATVEESSGVFCALPKPRKTDSNPPSLHEAVLAEMQALSPWYQLALDRNRGRTTVGASAMSVSEALEFLSRLINQEQVEPAANMTLGQCMRLAAEDLRAWFCESRIARPGVNPDPAVVANWFWGETAAGRLLVQLYPVAIDHEDPSIRSEGRASLIPRSQQHRL